MEEKEEEEKGEKERRFRFLPSRLSRASSITGWEGEGEDESRRGGKEKDRGGVRDGTTHNNNFTKQNGERLASDGREEENERRRSGGGSGDGGGMGFSREHHVLPHTPLLPSFSSFFPSFPSHSPQAAVSSTSFPSRRRLSGQEISEKALSFGAGGASSSSSSSATGDLSLSTAQREKEKSFSSGVGTLPPSSPQSKREKQGGAEGRRGEGGEEGNNDESEEKEDWERGKAMKRKLGFSSILEEVFFIGVELGRSSRRSEGCQRLEEEETKEENHKAGGPRSSLENPLTSPPSTFAFLPSTPPSLSSSSLLPPPRLSSTKQEGGEKRRRITKMNEDEKEEGQEMTSVPRRLPLPYGSSIEVIHPLFPPPPSTSSSSVSSLSSSSSSFSSSPLHSSRRNRLRSAPPTTNTSKMISGGALLFPSSTFSSTPLPAAPAAAGAGAPPPPPNSHNYNIWSHSEEYRTHSSLLRKKDVGLHNSTDNKDVQENEQKNENNAQNKTSRSSGRGSRNEEEIWNQSEHEDLDRQHHHQSDSPPDENSALPAEKGITMEDDEATKNKEIIIRRRTGSERLRSLESSARGSVEAVLINVDGMSGASASTSENDQQDVHENASLGGRVPPRFSSSSSTSLPPSFTAPPPPLMMTTVESPLPLELSSSSSSSGEEHNISSKRKGGGGGEPQGVSRAAEAEMESACATPTPTTIPLLPASAPSLGARSKGEPCPSLREANGVNRQEDGKEEEQNNNKKHYFLSDVDSSDPHHSQHSNDNNSNRRSSLKPSPSPPFLITRNSSSSSRRRSHNVGSTGHLPLQLRLSSGDQDPGGNEVDAGEKEEDNEGEEKEIEEMEAEEAPETPASSASSSGAADGESGGEKPFREPFLIRLRWRLPMFIGLLVFVLFILTVAYYTQLLVYYQHHYHGDNNNHYSNNNDTRERRMNENFFLVRECAMEEEKDGKEEKEEVLGVVPKLVGRRESPFPPRSSGGGRGGNVEESEMYWESSRKKRRNHSRPTTTTTNSCSDYSSGGGGTGSSLLSAGFHSSREEVEKASNRLFFTFVVVLLIIQILSGALFFLSFYVVLTISSGKVPGAPWRCQPWYLNPRTCLPPYPSNTVESIVSYHNNAQHPTIKEILEKEKPPPYPLPLSPLPLFHRMRNDLQHQEQVMRDVEDHLWMAKKARRRWERHKKHFLQNESPAERRERLRREKEKDLDPPPYQIIENCSPLFNDWRRCLASIPADRSSSSSSSSVFSSFRIWVVEQPLPAFSPSVFLKLWKEEEEGRRSPFSSSTTTTAIAPRCGSVTVIDQPYSGSSLQEGREPGGREIEPSSFSSSLPPCSRATKRGKSIPTPLLRVVGGVLLLCGGGCCGDSCFCRTSGGDEENGASSCRPPSSSARGHLMNGEQEVPSTGEEEEWSGGDTEGGRKKKKTKNRGGTTPGMRVGSCSSGGEGSRLFYINAHGKKGEQHQQQVASLQGGKMKPDGDAEENAHQVLVTVQSARPVFSSTFYPHHYNSSSSISSSSTRSLPSYVCVPEMDGIKHKEEDNEDEEKNGEGEMPMENAPREITPQLVSAVNPTTVLEPFMTATMTNSNATQSSPPPSSYTLPPPPLLTPPSDLPPSPTSPFSNPLCSLEISTPPPPPPPRSSTSTTTTRTVRRTSTTETSIMKDAPNDGQHDGRKTNRVFRVENIVVVHGGAAAGGGGGGKRSSTSTTTTTARTSSTNPLSPLGRLPEEENGVPHHASHTFPSRASREKEFRLHEKENDHPPGGGAPGKPPSEGWHTNGAPPPSDQRSSFPKSGFPCVCCVASSSSFAPSMASPSSGSRRSEQGMTIATPTTTTTTTNAVVVAAFHIPPRAEERDSDPSPPFSSPSSPRRKTRNQSQNSPELRSQALRAVVDKAEEEESSTIKTWDPLASPYIHLEQVNPYFITVKEAEGDYRYCFACHLYKPDLAYHCRICQQCVYNFDHHCPYVNKCIGRNNYRPFITFLLYATLASGLNGVAPLLCLAIMDPSPNDGVKWGAWLVGPVLSLILAMLLGRFLIKHIILIRQGRTTIEKIIQKRKEQAAREAKVPPPSDPYTLMGEGERRKKALVHQEILFGPPSWRRWLGVLNPFPWRTDRRPTELIPVVYFPSQVVDDEKGEREGEERE